MMRNEEEEKEGGGDERLILDKFSIHCYSRKEQGNKGTGYEGKGG